MPTILPAPHTPQMIEEERAKVEARTPVTAATFEAWHAKKREERRLAREEKEAERRKKGILNGREIFMQVGAWGGVWCAGVQGAHALSWARQLSGLWGTLNMAAVRM